MHEGPNERSPLLHRGRGVGGEGAMPRITRLVVIRATHHSHSVVTTACTGAGSATPTVRQQTHPFVDGKPAFDAYEATLIGQITLPH